MIGVPHVLDPEPIRDAAANGDPGLRAGQYQAAPKLMQDADVAADAQPQAE
jgi:hypothetical protein